uniref:Family with sequence similarity 204 member A n=1 Tax=Kryptolebias marmoratus TaxID=37003 RepID=A0A3Q3A156_KRYMA
MYSGLLPKGLTEAELSSDPEEENADGKKELTEDLSRSVSNSAPRGDADNDSCSLPGISAEMWLVCPDAQLASVRVKILEKRSRRHRRGKSSDTNTRSQDDCEKHWNDLKQYFNVNDRFLPPACSRPPPQSGLEKSMEKAIAEGDVAKAEEMSDRLATREVRSADKRSLGVLPSLAAAARFRKRPLFLFVLKERRFYERRDLNAATS